MIDRNIALVRERILQASLRAGVPAGRVTLVAVTKTFTADRMRDALKTGISDIGESRIQEAQAKFAELADILSGVTKHLIGHLQTNKAKKAVELFDLIESVDSARLAEEISRQAEKSGKVQDCLIEIKISEEETKFGLPPGELDRFLDWTRGLAHMRVRGLMTIAPYSDDPEQARPYFRQMKALFDETRSRRGPPDFNVLSMGMSNDFEIAIEEGATMVRVGTAIFGER